MELDLKARLIFAFRHPVLAALQGETGGEAKGGRLCSEAHPKHIGHLSSLCTPDVAALR